MNSNNLIDFEAHVRWNKILKEHRELLLSKGFCINCEGHVGAFAHGYHLELDEYGNILLRGVCKTCGTPMVRVVEPEWYGGEYVFDNTGYDEDLHDDDDDDYGYYDDVSETFGSYVDEFFDWLNNKGLSDQTIDKHMFNVNFYLTNYVENYRGCKDIKESCSMILGFLGGWYIYHCIWASVTDLKANATSLKRFYKCMLELGYIEKSDYDRLTETIKEEQPGWIKELKKSEAL